MEDTEKKARVIVNDRLDSLLFDIQDVMAAKGNPRSEKVDVDTQEAYGPEIICGWECNILTLWM